MKIASLHQQLVSLHFIVDQAQPPAAVVRARRFVVELHFLVEQAAVDEAVQHVIAHLDVELAQIALHLVQRQPLGARLSALGAHQVGHHIHNQLNLLLSSLVSSRCAGVPRIGRL